MKNSFLIFLLFATPLINAQRGGGGMGRGQQQNQNGQSGNREIKEIKAADMAGIYYYDVRKVIKKLKVKDDKLKASLTKALMDYNFKVKEIALLNADNFKALDILLKSRRSSRRMPSESNDDQTNNQDDFRQTMGKIIRPIRTKLNDNELILNEIFQNLLSEKQNKKWLKYQISEKEKLMPQRPDRNNRNQNGQQPQMQNRQRRF